MSKWMSLVASIVLSVSAANIYAHPNQVAFVNHLYAVVDRETIDAIEQSSYLADFIDYEKKTVRADGGSSWTGRYFTGKSTYIELFGAGDLKGGIPGAVGLAFGTDRIGDVDKIERHLERDGANYSRSLRSRNFDGEEIDWFHALGLEVENRGAYFWLMEYVKEYLDHPAAEKEVAEGEWDLVSRERYNSDDYRGKLVQDTRYIAFHVSRESIPDSMPLFLAAGYNVSEGEGVTRLIGQEAEIALFHSEGGMYGLAELRFILNRSVADRHIERIGSSELVVGPGKTAIWKFALQEPQLEN
ncbi:DUF5829 family protein [Biformimicrobium ophioploci]|uniref:Uncharacterized protein n=1 Tax=Biformimicrobium ophioploci TaxID=3036711 RepID=A0ABQ6LY01_9GAMM|nr:DUF5829 family protein [Microbulbifer sp. NKW57]GMG86965.1 hypothetical protein MNKW57_12860 [Microbulbifer sp. NKW57]